MSCCWPAMPNGSIAWPSPSARGGSATPLCDRPVPMPTPSPRRARGSSASTARPTSSSTMPAPAAGCPLVETTAEDALAMIEVPYLAAFNLTRAFLPTCSRAAAAASPIITSPASYHRLAECVGLYRRAPRRCRPRRHFAESSLRAPGISVTLVVLGTVEILIGSTIPAAASACPRPIRATRADPVMPNKPPRRSVDGVAAGKRIGGKAGDLPGAVRAQRARSPASSRASSAAPP